MTPELIDCETYADLLAACDEAISSGSAIPALPDGDRLDRMVDCLFWLHQQRTVQQVGRFRVLRELGRGGFGVVYRAFDPHLNRDVALKLPRPDTLLAEGMRERFHREARLAAGLDHPNIVPVYEAGEAGPACYIASAYCPGPNLREWLRTQTEPVPVADAAKLVAAVADGVSHAHSRGIVHRDLKPANILLSGTGNREPAANDLAQFSSSACPVPKITDFGLAKFADLGQSLTRSGAVLGTPNYMAPEQAEGHKAVGPLADVYALGAILYELLTGRPPFVGESDLDTLRQAIAVEPVPPSQLRLRLPRDLETICLKCLEKDPGRRYLAATDLAADLRRYLAGEPVQARRVGALGRLGKRARRHPVAAGLLAIVIFLMVGGSTAVTVLWLITAEALRSEQYALKGEKEQRERTEATLAAQRIALAQRDWTAGNPEAARQHLELCPQEYRDREWRYIERLCRSELHRLSDGPKLLSSVRFSSDGRWILAHEPASIAFPPLTVWNANTGKRVFKSTWNDIQIADAAFSESGRHVAVLCQKLTRRGEAGAFPLSDPTGTMVVTLDFQTGNEVRRLERTAAGEYLGPIMLSKLSADARMFVTVDKGGQTIRAFHVETGKELHSFHNPYGPMQAMVVSPDGRYVAATTRDRGTVVWDLASEREVMTIPARSDGPHRIWFGPDKSRLVVTHVPQRTNHGIVQIIGLPSGEQLSSFEASWAMGRQVAVSPRNDLLAAPGIDNTVLVWDAATGRTMWTLRGHTNQVYCLAFSPDGMRLASCGWDGTVRIWDVSPFDE